MAPHEKARNSAEWPPLKRRGITRKETFKADISHKYLCLYLKINSPSYQTPKYQPPAPVGGYSQGPNYQQGQILKYQKSKN